MHKISDYTIIQVKATQPKEIIDYGIRMAGAPLEWREVTGRGVRVGIIDTGIDLIHRDLSANIADAVSFVSDSPQDDNGHGTHVAGIIGARKNGFGVVGMAPECSLYIAKAFDKHGNGEFSAIKKSLEWMIRKRVQIVNMSFSSEESSEGYEEILQAAINHGITLICAAGNEGSKRRNTIGFPGKFPQTIAVTAVDPNRKSTAFSSVGYESELCAAGVDIVSTYPGNSYAKLSGTSMATPIISGAAALMQAKGMYRYRRFLSPKEVRFLLHLYTEDLGGKGWDPYYGYGLFSFGRLNQSDFV
ncbi:MAG: peptidase S8 [Ruminococcaceae bacterium]|nr:peptidase S8 [Oscillospiraceae bacterium]